MLLERRPGGRGARAGHGDRDLATKNRQRDKTATIKACSTVRECAGPTNPRAGWPSCPHALLRSSVLRTPVAMASCAELPCHNTSNSQKDPRTSQRRRGPWSHGGQNSQSGPEDSLSPKCPSGLPPRKQPGSTLLGPVGLTKQPGEGP